MPLQGEAKKQYQKKLMQKRRSNKKLVQGLTKVKGGLTEEGLKEMGLTHPVLKYLVPGKERDKMERIVQSLKRHNQLENVFLGCGVYSLPLDVVAGMMEVTG